MDPIAVDVSVKSPLSLGLGSRPITTLNGSSSARPEVKPEPAKPPFTAPTPATVAATTLPGKIANTLGFQPTRKNGLVLAAAACSLVVGIAAVKYLAPARPAEGTQALVADSTKPKEEPKPAEVAKPVETRRPAAVVEDPNSTFIPSAYPMAPSSPPALTYVPAAVPPTPTYVPSTVPPVSTYVPPVVPSSVPPSTPTVPSAVIPASLPVVPTIPSVPGSTDGFVTAGTSKTGGTAIPLPGNLVQPSIAPPSLFPASASEPVIPTTAPVPSAPPSTLPTIPTTVPSVVPVLPATPPIPPTTLVIPPTAPPTPVIPPTAPATFVLPPSPFPSTTPPAAEASKPLTIEYSKPIGSPDVKPAVPDRVATTSFDVDLHEPKNGDTYSSIAKEFYNDVKYAGALQEHNGRRALQTSVRVEVPPIHVLKKRYPQLISAIVPASGMTGDVWSASGEGATPAFRASGQRSFTVPTGGMTMGSIARDTLGSPTRWRDIYDLNPSLSPGDVLPAGTVLKIPSEVKPNN